MKLEDKIKILAEEVFQIEQSELKPETILNSIPSWDSMAALALISVFEEYFQKLDIDGATIRKFEKVQDILDLMD